MKKRTVSRKPSREERIRTFFLNIGARVLSREMIHYDFDKLKRLGVIQMGRRSGSRPKVRGYYSAEGQNPQVRIGDYSGVHSSAEFILSGEHHLEWVTTFPIRDVVMKRKGADGPFAKGDIEVGSDVWIGYNAQVMSGVTIGHGAVVAAGATVTKDVRPYAIVGGVPAKEIRRRFDDATVEALLRIKWWDWPEDRIVEHADLLCSDRLDEFIERFDPGPQSGT